MSTQSQTASALDGTSVPEENKEKDISQEYEKLNQRCDVVITKIKKRKEKKPKKTN